MKHLAIIADGNRRWAKENDLPVETGYPAGLATIERICEWAIARQVEYLTVYCFSTENWSRPQEQVDAIMELARWCFSGRRDWYIARGIQVRFAGRRDRLAADIADSMNVMEQETQSGRNLTMTICMDYGGRDEIVRAIQKGARTEKEITWMLTHGIPDPDTILRTGGHQRLSNFMLWQCAYSELYFTDTLFPALEDEELDSVLAQYEMVEQHYGC